MSQFVRARRPEQKQERREAILTAARRLAIEAGVDHVSLGRVAEAVGLAKSNVVRYFGTREEIYLELAGECWRDWRDHVTERLASGEDAVDALTETFQARPLFCDLLSHASTSLEHNVSVAAAYAYKDVMVATIGEVGAAVARACPSLTAGEGFEIVSAAAGMAGVLHAAANPPPTVAEVFAEHADLARALPQFEPTMRRLLGALVAGFPALRTGAVASGQSDAR